MKYQVIKTENLQHDNAQMRTKFQFEDILESVKLYGILTPLVVWEIAKGMFEILQGNRRFACGVSLGLTEFPCFIVKVANEREKLLVKNDYSRRTLAEYDIARLILELRLDKGFSEESTIAQIRGLLVQNEQGYNASVLALRKAGMAWHEAELLKAVHANLKGKYQSLWFACQTPQQREFLYYRSFSEIPDNAITKPEFFRKLTLSQIKSLAEKPLIEVIESLDNTSKAQGEKRKSLDTAKTRKDNLQVKSSAFLTFLAYLSGDLTITSSQIESLDAELYAIQNTPKATPNAEKPVKAIKVAKSVKQASKSL